jgi:flagellar capping protein FliD
MSKDGLSSQVTDPFTESISSASEFTLTVDGEEYSIVPAEATLAELAEAINSSGAAVEATIVNIGSASDPDYRLSFRSTKLGEVSVQLNDGSMGLLDTTATGTLAEYRVNDQPAAAITSDTRAVTIAPGLTMTMLKEGSTSVTVSHNVASLSNSLSALASAYNAAVAEIDKHRGKDAGVLEGSSLLYTLSQSLRDIVTYDSGAEGISSLASLGMEFDDSGNLSLDMVAFGTVSTGDFEKIEDFLGSAATSGFLKYAADITDGLQENTTGAFDVAITSLSERIAWQDTRIAEEEDRLAQLEENLVARMAAADAMIASLERQVTYMTGLFESMRSYGSSL